MGFALVWPINLPVLDVLIFLSLSRMSGKVVGYYFGCILAKVCRDKKLARDPACNMQITQQTNLAGDSKISV